MKKLFLFFITILCLNQIFSETEKKEEKLLTVSKIGEYKCGKQPKQVLFSPDSKYIVLPLLNDNGFDIFDIESKIITKRINPPNSKFLGFAEGLFIKSKNAFLVSQMTTAKLYEYSYPDFSYKRTINTEGTWSKFIAFSEEKNLLCVSNWVSNNISLIDYDSGKVVKKIKTSAAPRGLAFINKGTEIVVLCFDGGKIQKFNTETGVKSSEIAIKNSAMRHIVVNKEETKAFISDMFFKMIYELDLKSFKITKKVKVFNNPNTIDLKNDRFLFVSCRGPNNKSDYTARSPENGKIFVIDTETMNIEQSFEGGNQPTGLDIDETGKLLCFSNFQDANIELYELKELRKEND